MINPMIIVRDVHFASSVIVAGIIFFDILIALPIFRQGSRFPAAERSFGNTANKILWISLALSVGTALAWLFLLSARITHRSISEVVTDGTIWTVLTQTQFGVAWEIRLTVGALLGIGLLVRRKAAKEDRTATGPAILASLLAGAYLGSLAFAGHGAEGLGSHANIHLAADILHLIGAALWLGVLIPFALLLNDLRRFEENGWLSAAAAMANRFSTLAIAAVGILLVSGTINASFLLDGMHSLTDTAYGRLLLLKVAFFVAMLCLAGVNRQRLLPRLGYDAKHDQSSRTVRQLLRNSLIEIALGGAIVLVVGMLGIMVPAREMANHVH